MRLARRVRAATAVVAAVVFCGVWGLPRPAWAGGDDEETHVILFSGRDLWRNGGFLYGGLLIAPGGFEQDGIMLKPLYSGGLYRYNAGSLGGGLRRSDAGLAHQARTRRDEILLRP